MLSSEDRIRKLFSEELKEEAGKRYKITVKSKAYNQSKEYIKSQWK